MRPILLIVLMMIGCAPISDNEIAAVEELNETHATDEAVFINEGAIPTDLYDNLPPGSLPSVLCVCNWEVVHVDDIVCLRFVCPDNCATLCDRSIVCSVMMN